MKGLVYVLMTASIVALILGLVTKYSTGATTVRGTVAGVGPTGYLNVAIVLLLLGANLALLELLKKK